MNKSVSSLHSSLSGIRFALNEESVFCQEFLLACLLVSLAIWLPVSFLQTVLMIGYIVFLPIVELLHYIFESSVDRISFSHHSLSKRAKD